MEYLEPPLLFLPSVLVSLSFVTHPSLISISLLRWFVCSQSSVFHFSLSLSSLPLEISHKPYFHPIFTRLTLDWTYSVFEIPSQRPVLTPTLPSTIYCLMPILCYLREKKTKNVQTGAKLIKEKKQNKYKLWLSLLSQLASPCLIISFFLTVSVTVVLYQWPQT